MLVAASPKADARWCACTADQLRPLVDWVCATRSLRAGRRRVSEAVKVLERPAGAEYEGTGMVGALYDLPSSLFGFLTGS